MTGTEHHPLRPGKEGSRSSSQGGHVRDSYSRGNMSVCAYFGSAAYLLRDFP